MQEQIARAATGFFDALKNQPLSLALVVMNLGLLGYLYYEGVNYNASRKHETDLLYKNRRDTALLLARCNWPEGQPLPKNFNSDE